MKKKLIAEFLGTYFLVFAGTSAIVINTLTNSLTHVGIAATFGLVVMALIYTFGHVSGAHFNPAVTIGFLIHGDVTKREAASYILIQLLAAMAASGTVYELFGNVASLGATLPTGSWEQSFLLEFILTFFLMMVILGSAIHDHLLGLLLVRQLDLKLCLRVQFAGHP